MSQPSPFDPKPTEGFPPSNNPYAAGSAYDQSGYGAPNPNQTPMLLAVGSLVTGGAGLTSCGCCLFMPLPVLALILGAVALTMKPDQNAKIMAIIGIGLGAFTILGWIVMLVFQIGLGVSQEFQPNF